MSHKEKVARWRVALVFLFALTILSQMVQDLNCRIVFDVLMGMRYGVGESRNTAS